MNLYKLNKINEEFPFFLIETSGRFLPKDIEILKKILNISKKELDKLSKNYNMDMLEYLMGGFELLLSFGYFGVYNRKEMSMNYQIDMQEKEEK
jgi:hypothetical protein